MLKWIQAFRPATRCRIKQGCGLVALLLTAINGISQPPIEWQRSLGGSLKDNASTVIQTNDGGYILAATTYSANGHVVNNHGGADCWIIKLDQTGNIVWQRSLGGSAVETARSIEQTTDGGFIIAGSSNSNNGDVISNRGGSDYWIIKLNSNGALQWQRSLGGSENDWAECIKQTSDGGYIVAGWSYSGNGDVTGHHAGPKIKGKPQLNADYWIVKLNSSGAVQWQRSLGGSQEDMAYSVQQTNDGGFIVAGGSSSSDGDVTGHHDYGNYATPTHDYWIVKLNNSGAIQWKRSLGGDNKDQANSIIQTNDGGYLVTGESSSGNGDVSGHHGVTQQVNSFCVVTPDYWVVKLNNSGIIQWQRSLGGTAGDIAYSATENSDGYTIAGYSGSNDGDVSGNHGQPGLQFCRTANYYSHDYWIIQLDVDGNIRWQKCLGGTRDDDGRSVQPTGDGGFIVAGQSRSNDADVSFNYGDEDCWIVKLGSGNGSSRMQKTMLQSEAIDPTFKIYPNPATNQVHIYWPGTGGADARIILINAGGQQVKQFSHQTPVSTIDLTGLAGGLYIYQLRYGRKIFKTGKLVIK